MNGPRYAIYFAPSGDDDLAHLGAGLLGYDAAAGSEIEQRTPAGLSATDWRAWTAEPRRYGFHATLKAPFRLHASCNEDELVAALTRFACGRRAFSFGLKLTWIGGFIALTPVSAPSDLEVLEDAIVKDFEPFRAPLNEKDLARRLAAPLTARQRDLLDRYGYPYVLDQFRFHMTLTGRLDDGQRAQVLPALASLVPTDLCARVQSLCLFRQQSAEERFRILARAPLACA